MTYTSYCDSESGESKTFADFEVEAEIAWISKHRAAVHIETKEIPQRIIDAVVEGVLET